MSVSEKLQGDTECLKDRNEWLKTSIKQCVLLTLINIRLYGL